MIRSNKVTELRRLFQNELNGFYDSGEIDSFFFILLEAYSGLRKLDLHSDDDLRVSESVIIRLNQSLLELKEFKPVQYITGQAQFLDLELSVNPGVLIPRPETEELVQWIISDYPGKLAKRILDIGTGSGCIAISLARYFEDCEVDCIDSDQEAIKTAKINSERLNVDINLWMENIFREDLSGRLGKYDIIVSNPPYVTHSEKTLMQENVLKYEPEKALFVSDNDPLVYYRRIFHLASRHLKVDGRIYLEINESKQQDMIDLMRGYTFKNYTFKKDLRGKTRFLRIY
jgi:release factor glutamine methyltransferase